MAITFCTVPVYGTGKDHNTMKTNRFISAKRFFALLLTVLLFTAAFCLPVSAETEGTEFTVPGTTMTVTLPEGVQVLHASTPDEDPVLPSPLKNPTIPRQYLT